MDAAEATEGKTRVRGSFILSAMGHSALLGWVLFTIQTQSPPRAPQLEPPMDFTLITPGEMTKLTQGVRTAKQLDAQPKEAPKSEPAPKEADKPKPVATAPPPPEPPPPPKEEPKSDPIAEKLASATPPPPPAPAAPPVPSPEEQKKLDDLMKAQEDRRRAEEEHKKREEAKKKKEEERKKQAELKKKREEEKKRKEAELKKKQDDEFKKISALLNKIPDKGAPAPSSEPIEPGKKKGPVIGAPEGRDKQLTASELAILGQIIKTCVQSKWSVLGGGEGAQGAVVKVRLRFNPDGRLAAAPTVMNPQNTPAFLAVSDSALRAVQACEPFPLPSDKYDFWKDIVLNFDPRDMF